MKFLMHLLNTAMFLAAWVGACIALYWLTMQLLLTSEFPPGQPLPPSFSVVVESRAKDAPPTYESRRFRSQSEFKLEPGESLHLSARTYDQTDHEVSGSCCIDFRVLEDTPDGQLIELNDDDMSYVMSRYRVRNGQVQPVAHRMDFSLYYLGYFFVGGFLAWLLTRPLRRRTLNWANSRLSA
jgi:hypothetical protein